MSDFETRFRDLKLALTGKDEWDRQEALKAFHLEWAAALEATDPQGAMKQYSLAEDCQWTIGTFSTGGGEGLAELLGRPAAPPSKPPPKPKPEPRPEARSAPVPVKKDKDVPPSWEAANPRAKPPPPATARKAAAKGLPHALHGAEMPMNASSPSAVPDREARP